MATEYYEMPARQYDPWTGRMNGVDPLADNYSSWTPYNYAFNDPVYLNDPSGASPFLARTRDPDGVYYGNFIGLGGSSGSGFGRTGRFGRNPWGNGFGGGIHGNAGAGAYGVGNFNNLWSRIISDPSSVQAGHYVNNSDGSYDYYHSSQVSYAWQDPGDAPYYGADGVGVQSARSELTIHLRGKPARSTKVSVTDLALAGVGTLAFVGERLSQNILNSRSGFSSGKIFENSAKNFSKQTARNTKLGLRIGGFALSIFSAVDTERQFDRGVISQDRRELNHLNNVFGTTIPVAAIPIAAGDYIGQRYADEINSTTIESGGVFYETTRYILELLGIPTTKQVK